MALRKRKPTSPGSRHRIDVIRDVHKGSGYKPLMVIKPARSGRNNQGRITTRHRSGGHKKFYRLIDFKRSKEGVPAKVERIEYDPNRSAFIALLLYADGERRYIVAPKNIEKNTAILSAEDAPIVVGNCLPLSNIPLGTVIHCVEMRPKKGAQLVRSAGASCQLVAKEGSYVTIRLRSGEMRKILATCRATVGEVSNSEHNLRSLGKAGAARHRGRRPTVRGVAMNPVDHPHGGGEGKTSGGRHPVTPWGVPTKGYRTRNNKRTQRYIVRSRHKRK